MLDLDMKSFEVHQQSLTESVMAHVYVYVFFLLKYLNALFAHFSIKPVVVCILVY